MPITEKVGVTASCFRSKTRACEKVPHAKKKIDKREKRFYVLRKEFDNATTRKVKNEREREPVTTDVQKKKNLKDYQKRVFALKKMSIA